jgi:hypothetical protein
MPTASKHQIAMVQAKRHKYGSKEDTPQEYKWIWRDDWTEGDKMSELPKTNDGDMEEARSIKPYLMFRF